MATVITSEKVYSAAELESLFSVYGGTMNNHGHRVTLIQEAYLSGTSDDPYYEATGCDDYGNCYNVRWEIINNETDDESDACDWSNPYMVLKLA